MKLEYYMFEFHVLKQSVLTEPAPADLKLGGGSSKRELYEVGVNFLQKNVPFSR